MDNLSNDILVIIFTYLFPKDLSRIVCVNKRFKYVSEKLHVWEYHIKQVIQEIPITNKTFKVAQQPEGSAICRTFKQSYILYERLKIMQQYINKIQFCIVNSTIRSLYYYTTSLNLDNSKLPIPKEIVCLEMQLVAFPGCYATVENLSYLSIQSCNLTSIPEGICDLANLVKLDLHCNKIVNLPDNFKKLVNLEILILADNYIEEFPRVLLSLEKLRRIDLRLNRISVIPDNHFEYLNLDRNPCNFPDYIEKLNISDL